MPERQAMNCTQQGAANMLAGWQGQVCKLPAETFLQSISAAFPAGQQRLAHSTG